MGGPADALNAFESGIGKMAVARLVVEVNADLRNLQRDLDRATGAIQRFAGGLKSTGTALTIGITAPLAALGVSVGKAAADMDSLRRGLTAVAGSSKAAEEQLRRLEDIAKLPGLGFREAIQGSVRLQAVGLSVALTERALRSFGNAVALTGGGKTELDRITLQLGQLSGKGRVLAQDMRIIMDAAPATGRALREAFGTTDTEAIQKLNLTTEQFLTRLFDALDRLPRVTGGVKNSFENLTDSLFRARVVIGEQLLPVIVPLVDGLTRTLEKVRTLDPNTVRWALSIAAVAAVVGPLVIVVGQLTAAVTALTVALGVAGLAGTIATGGILLLLGGLSALFLKNKLDALAAASAADTYRASLIGLSRGQLLSNLIAEQSKLMDLHVSQASLRASGRGFERGFRPEGISEAFQRGGIVAALNPRQGVPFVRETEDLRKLGEEANTTGARIASLKRALELLNNASTAPTPPPAPSGGGRDKLAGLLDGLTDRLRELQTLQRFNVSSLDFLPEDVQEQIRLADTLSGQLDTLRDGLRRFQQAGRTPPAGLTWGIEALAEQLGAVERGLDRISFKFSRFNELQARVNIRVQPAPVGELPERQRLKLGSGGQLIGLGENGNVRASLQAGQLGVAASQALSAALQGLREAVTQTGRALFEFGNSQLRGAISGAASMAAQFTPAGLAAYALSQAMEALRPALDAVLLPIKIFGEIIAAGVTPVLRLLFPILKALAIILSYVQEAFERVIGTLLKGIGWFVRAIGKVVNFLDPFGNPGNGLVKLGNGLRDSAQGFFDAADEIKKRRKELQGLSFDDALNRTSDSLNRLTESVLNAVQGFKVQKYRFAAASGVMTGEAGFSVPTQTVRAGATASSGTSYHVGEVHLHAAPGEDVVELWQRLKAVIQQEARHVPGMRPLAAQLG